MNPAAIEPEFVVVGDLSDSAITSLAALLLVAAGDNDEPESDEPDDSGGRPK